MPSKRIAKLVQRSIRVHGYLKKPAFNDWYKNGGVAVTTYETISTIEIEKDARFDLLVVDEAHYIKNPGALRSKAVVGLSTHADRIIFMTGTPLENKVEEMITLVDVLNPAVATDIRKLAFLSTAPAFREKIAPVYFRRKREAVIDELPEKEELETWVDLMPEEKDLYEQSVLKKNTTAVRRVSWAIQDPDKSSKALRVKEIVEEAAQEGRNVLVFSFYKETLRMLSRFLDRNCAGTIDGSVPVETRQRIIDSFGQKTESSVSPEEQQGKNVLLCQIYAGGTGLNIQAASIVIICEPQLKPSIEDQAISRAYRLGQAHKVSVYRLLASNTIDERISDLLEKKRTEFKAFADASAAAEKAQQLDEGIEDKTFGKLIQEEIDRINKEKGYNPSQASGQYDGEFKTKTADGQFGMKGSARATNTKTNEQNNPEGSSSQPNKNVSAENHASSDNTGTPIKPVDIQRTSATSPRQNNDEKPNKPLDFKGDKEISKKNIQMSFFEQDNTIPNESSVSFASVDALIRYMNDEGITYRDNRSKNGCLWILSNEAWDSWVKTIRIGGQPLHYSQSARALDRRPGWYLS